MFEVELSVNVAQKAVQGDGNNSREKLTNVREQADQAITFQVFLSSFSQQNGFKLLPIIGDDVLGQAHTDDCKSLSKFVPSGSDKLNVDAVVVWSSPVLLHSEGCANRHS